MTAAEVVEAMARGIIAAGYNPATAHDIARAAIRALPLGWCVTQVPEDRPYIHTGRYKRSVQYAEGHDDGWDAAIEAVRAAAVVVDPKP